MRLLGSPELPFARLFNLTVMKWRSQDHAELMGLVRLVVAACCTQLGAWHCMHAHPLAPTP